MMSTDSTSSANKTWELSLYELNRTPQEAITDSTEIAVSPRSLHNELMCPICLDMLNETMTTKECLHRFCADCIITALRSGNKECPTCRKKLVSKRSLRPDPNFDELIKKIYPSRDEYEAHQERVLQKLNMNHNPTALAHSIEAGLKLQALSRAQRVRKNQLDQSVDAPVISANTGAIGLEVLTSQVPPSLEPSTTPPPDLQKLSQLPIVTTPFQQQQQSLAPLNNQNVTTMPTLIPTAPSSQPLAPPPPPSLTAQNMSPSNHVLQQHHHHHHHQQQQQQQQLEQQRKKQKTTSAEESAGSGAEASHESVGEGDGHSSESSMRMNEIELVFKPHPLEDGLNDGHIRYIKTTANATVDHLSRYLMMRLALDFKTEEPGTEAPFADSAHFNIFIASTPGQFSMLNGNMTLDQVNEKYWKVNKPLEMYYSFKK